eukprot:GHUV01018080.1.p1 GENE.GHUV01018080.1~~GHUV01018080.1.p1  ORF type:complete len:169 (+),score=51.31 GHUV01018080.1:880-1386(+)
MSPLAAVGVTPATLTAHTFVPQSRHTCSLGCSNLPCRGRSLFHAGMARAGYQLGTATAGEVAQKAMETGKGNYLANLVLYPGRDEFVKYLPEATQGVIVQPLGNAGVMVVGTDTLRGLSRLDQAWIANIADKLEVSLEGYTVTGTGFAKASSSSSSRKEQKSNKTTAN